MELKSPPFISQLPFTPPDSIPIHEFLFSDRYGRHPRETSKNPFTCGITGKTYSTSQVEERVDFLARALSKKLGIEVNDGDEMQKIIGIFSLNTVDNMTVSWAIHRLSGVSFPLSASSSTTELVHLLSQVRCKALVTCAPLVHTALECAAAVGIPDSHVYVLDVPLHDSDKLDVPTHLKSVDQLIREGGNMAPLAGMQWAAGQGARQTAYLCSSSGTSGLPKFVKVSHKSVIANIMQFTAYESNNTRKEPEMGLGVLPQSHGYSLILIAHASVYRGDGVVVLQGFDMHATLQAIQDFHIARLWLMIVAMTRASLLLHRYDLSSVNTVFVGGSPLTVETAVQFSELISNCTFIQAYGLTEAAILVCLTNREDVVFGSCGHLLPGFEARLIDENGQDVTEYDTPGELVVRSPSVMIGYYNNEAATREILSEDGWLRTGDLVEIRKSAKGYDHIFIVDRIKELIKVRGYQVAPAELETSLLLHPIVSDVAVVPIPSGSSGEVPMAYIVKSQACRGVDEAELKRQIHAYINTSFAKHKHLDGGIEFIDAIPKTAIGKTRRSIIKEMAKRSAQVNKQVITNGWRQMRVPVRMIEFDSDDEDD
ncbi:hypothetical protein DL765_009143 [Monosporascus sp. GIB2]|nr:hypothetical protein DL765_009143 [Monosporascus sp. GIB2]